ncbi:MAG TPA: flagellar export protein FliJ [Treponemataceae bacterium]|nr:flagellar export protein FliJ [Treponemataceae bacterium]
MRRFSFSLQRLLSLREFREREAEIALGKAVAERDRVQIELDDVAARRVRAVLDRRAGLSVNELMAIENYVKRLDVRKEELLVDLAAAEAVVETRREAYISARRDREVISKLRERKTEEWRKERLAEEAAVLDDIAGAARSRDETNT